MNTTATVNGKPHQFATAEDVPLLFALRNELGLTSAKLGCGDEQCGACVVLIDGKPRYTCTLPVQDAAGAKVETAEGLANAGAEPSRVQRALADHNALQCGFCITGIAMAAEALFRDEPHPDDAAIRQALEPHLCRCGAHPRILRALHELAEHE